MRMYDIIKDKRDGKKLTDAQIRFMIDGYVKGDIPDYQMSAFCMAVYFRGMDMDETVVLTDAMMRSGDLVDLSAYGDITVDKHSTGGVGDKTSLIILPIVCACGCIAAKMSGRGLGHTGGTVDKLESFDGYDTELSPEAFAKQVRDIGIALVGQSGNLTPADKKLYALRDVTATVDSIPLIASSIMSKKLAAGAKNIVLDVKCGSGAFMKTPEDARALADTMVKIGEGLSRNVSAVVTNMDTPLGFAVGNALEVKEAADVLAGNGPDDLKTVSLTLAANIISMAKKMPFDEAMALANDALTTGSALDKMREWISAQGGNPDISRLPAARNVIDVKSPRDGYISVMDAEKIGIVACSLGAGRVTKQDGIDHAAGIVLVKKTGDSVARGDVIAYLHTNKDCDLSDEFLSAIDFSDTEPEKTPLIY